MPRDTLCEPTNQELVARPAAIHNTHLWFVASGYELGRLSASEAFDQIIQYQLLTVDELAALLFAGLKLAARLEEVAAASPVFRQHASEMLTRASEYGHLGYDACEYFEGLLGVTYTESQ